MRNNLSMSLSYYVMGPSLFECLMLEGEFHSPLNIEDPGPFSFGGFLEARNGIDTGRHLGIDISVEQDEKDVDVFAPSNGMEVFDVFYDSKDQRNGWGGRVIFRMKDEYKGCRFLIVGHLEVFAKLATIGHSGTWWRHLHVQLSSELHLKYFADDLESLDGYCHDLEEDVSSLVSDPTDLVTKRKI